MTDVSDFPLDDPNGTVPTIPGAAQGYGASVPSPLTGVVNPPEATAEPTRVQLLKEAAGLITGERQEQYGPPSVSFTRIADIFNVIISRKLKDGERVDPADAALLLAGMKLARAAEGYKHDTAADLAGYAGLWAELSEG